MLKYTGRSKDLPVFFCAHLNWHRLSNYSRLELHSCTAARCAKYKDNLVLPVHFAADLVAPTSYFVIVLVIVIRDRLRDRDRFSVTDFFPTLAHSNPSPSLQHRQSTQDSVTISLSTVYEDYLALPINFAVNFAAPTSYLANRDRNSSSSSRSIFGDEHFRELTLSLSHEGAIPNRAQL